jgi:hypothetical protein
VHVITNTVFFFHEAHESEIEISRCVREREKKISWGQKKNYSKETARLLIRR